ncbi:MAG: ferredoxin [Acidimicrobiales bacterium]
MVDLSVCQGYAQCAFLAPEVFHMEGREVLLFDPAPTDDRRQQVERAAAACPVQAIVIEDVDVADADHADG